MSLFTRVDRRPAVEERVASFDATLAGLGITAGRSTYSGVVVDDDDAMMLSAVWACVDLISELVSTMPVDEYRRDGSGAPVPTNSKFLADPAGDGSGVEVWLRQVMTSLLLRGNGYGFVTSLDESMWPRTIEVLHPDRVALRSPMSGGPAHWLLDGHEIEKWPLGPLWQIPGYSVPGWPVGMSPIRYARETIGLGLASQKFGAQWFGDGAHPTSILETEQSVSQAQAELLKSRVVDAMYDNRRPLVLGNGTKLNSIQVSPEESQFLGTIQANVADVARFFRVPPEMIGGTSGNSNTYSNQEQRGMALLTYTVNGWLVRLERSLTRLRHRPRFVKFNSDALLRVDTATRYRAHESAIRSGWKSRDEVRLIEDLPPIPDGVGAEFLWPPYSTSPGADDPAMTEPATPGGFDE